jgi:putative ABC transport system substrate-binding protein
MILLGMSQMAIDIRRRQFISTLGLATFVLPLAARAQQSAKIPLVGYLTGDSLSADLPRRNSFRQGLRELGYIEGQSILVEYRAAAGSVEKLSEYAAELSRLSVDVIFAFTAGAVVAAAKAMPGKPIVSVTPDPVSAGLVVNLARPGGNITGLSTLAGTEMYGKYLELLKDAVPSLTRVAVLSNPTNSFSGLALRATEAAAPAFGLSVVVVEARSPGDLEGAVAAAAKEQAGGLVVVQDAMFLARRTELAELAAKSRVPAIYGIPEHVSAGGLMAYAASRLEIFRRAAFYIDKILKGTKPVELPG